MITGLNDYQCATDAVAQYPGRDHEMTKHVANALLQDIAGLCPDMVEAFPAIAQAQADLRPLINNIRNTGLSYVSYGLAGESGEFCDKVKKMLRDCGGDMSEELRDSLILELGDVLWYVAQAGRQLHVTMEEIATRNIAKLMDRKERGTLSGSGDNR